jgi:hypothetical protein
MKPTTTVSRTMGRYATGAGRASDRLRAIRCGEVIDSGSRELLAGLSVVLPHDGVVVEQVDGEDVGRLRDDLADDALKPLPGVAGRRRIERAQTLEEGDALAQEALEQGVGLHGLRGRFATILASQQAVDVNERQQADDDERDEGQPPEQRACSAVRRNARRPASGGHAMPADRRRVVMARAGRQANAGPVGLDRLVVEMWITDFR